MFATIGSVIIQVLDVVCLLACRVARSYPLRRLCSHVVQKIVFAAMVVNTSSKRHEQDGNA